MTSLTRSDLEALSRIEANYCTSIYCSTHAPGEDHRMGHIRLKDLLSKAQDWVKSLGMTEVQCGKMFRALNESLAAESFWFSAGQGLAVFITPSDTIIHRLPAHFSDTVVVADRLHLKPLLQLFQGNGRYFVLAVDQDHVKLYEGSRDNLAECATPELPRDFQDALKYSERFNSMQLASASSSSGTGGFGSAVSAPHGYGDDDDQVKKRELLQYCHVINHGLSRTIEDKSLPLVFAGVDYLFRIFQKACHYPNLIATAVTGSPIHWDLKTLHEKSWTIVEPFFRKSLTDALRVYHDHAHDELTSENLRAIVEASHEGRIDTLFIAEDRVVWGHVEPAQDQERVNVTVSPDDGASREDLLDYAGVQTFLKHGNVFLLKQSEMPHRRAAAAVFRYPFWSASESNHRAIHS